MANNQELLENIPDSKPVRVFLPLKDMPERYRMQGIYQKSTPPVFLLTFSPGSLPVESIDTGDTCIINVDMGGPTISLEANISEVSNPQQLVMYATKTISHEQMRDFFRVDAVTSVIGKSFKPELRKGEGSEWSLQGETVDISGSGILATFSEKPPEDRQIQLEITLPTAEPEIIRVLAQPVRTTRSGDNHFDVAYHFVDISMEDRDKIIGCCLEIQRKLLRLKIKVKDL